MSKEPTPTELMNAIVELHEAVSHGFAQVDARFAGLETQVTSIKGELSGMRRWMARTDQRLAAP